jgi:regulatory protein
MPVVEVRRDEPVEGRRPRARSIAVLLDGSAWLRVGEEELLELGVGDGDALEPARVEAVELALARTRARRFVVRSLAARAQSVAEIRAKLERRDVPPAVAQEAIDLATGYGYLDDAVLAAQLARGQRARGYGRRRAAQTLRARGLPDAVAEPALAEAYGDDETAEALAALGRRSFGEGDAGRRRAAAFLARRGFSPASAWAAVRRREQGPEPR